MDRRLHDLREIRYRRARLFHAWHRLPTGWLTVQEERALSRYFGRSGQNAEPVNS
jgi:hypothetical protein